MADVSAQPTKFLAKQNSHRNYHGHGCPTSCRHVNGECVNHLTCWPSAWLRQYADVSHCDWFFGLGNVNRVLYMDFQATWKHDIAVFINPSYIAVFINLKKKLRISVSDNWIPGRGWDWHRFQEHLPASALLRVTSTSLAEDEGAEDTFGWLEPTGKNFIVLAAYDLQ